MRRFILVTLFLTLACSLVCGQGYVAPPVKVSEEVVSIKGERFRVHKVEPKQTLYSISKAYNVTVDQIKEANAGLSEGVQSGNIIFIPDAFGKNGVRQESGQDTKANDSAQETGTKDPAAQNTAAVTPQDHRVHRVTWLEAIIFSAEDIAKKYGVSFSDLVTFNGLKSGKISSGQILVIPNPGEVITGPYVPPTTGEEQEQEQTGEQTEDEQQEEQQELTPEEEAALVRDIRRRRHFSSSDPAKVALLLPFDISNGSGNTNYIDFYCGFLLAINNLKDHDLHVDLTVYDISQKGVSEFIRTAQLIDEDLIVGPVNESDVEKMASFCNFNHIPFVSPMDQKADRLVDESPYLFQFPTPARTQRENLVASVAAGRSANVTVISESGVNTALVHELDSLLTASGVEYNSLSYTIVQGRNIGPTLAGKLDRQRFNKVVVASENEAFVLDVMRNLNIQKTHNRYDIEAWCMPKVRNFDKVDTEHLHNLNTHMSLPYFVDYTDPYVKTFVKQYRALYNADPSQFAFQGHDVAYYFLTALVSLGADVSRYAGYHTLNLLQSNVNFSRSESEYGGFRNTATRDVTYEEDYQISVTHPTIQLRSSELR